LGWGQRASMNRALFEADNHFNGFALTAASNRHHDSKTIEMVLRTMTQPRN
jgi:hypothetical protein